MRFQFEPREGHFLNFEEARRAIREHGGTHIQVVFPVMCASVRGAITRYWRGTNQPKTLAFSVSEEDVARRIEETYGWKLAFVRSRMSLR